MPTSWIRLSLLFAALCSAPAAHALDYPTRPVTLVVPFPPGGSVDVVGRLLAERLAAAWKQPVVVENRSGAAGTIGTASVARAQPDGYTLLMGGIGPNALTPLAKPVPYDPRKDLTPIAQVISQPFFLLVRSGDGYKSLADLVAAGKGATKLNYASAGVGSVSNFASELFNLGAGTQLQHVPYRGTAPALLGLQAGETSMYFAAGTDAVGMIRSGKFKPLLVTSPQRSAIAPAAPSLTEAGLKEPNIDSWYGVFGPAHMPAELVERINASIQAALRDPALKARIEGAELRPGGAAEFAALLQADLARLGPLIKQIGFKAE